MKKIIKETNDYIKVIENFDCKKFNLTEFLKEHPKSTFSEVFKFLEINGCYDKPCKDA
jgi:hypothetical protein